MKVILNSISKNFGSKNILKDINLEIAENSFTILKGVSGSGKSTLLNIIGGIESPTSGNIIIDNQNINNLKHKDRVNFYRKKIGFIFQGFYLQPQLTIKDNIALMAIFAGISRLEREKRVYELAEKLGIRETLNQLPSEISGGQAERACIARALYMSPEIILADEPTNNLDPDNAKNVIEILKTLQVEEQSTVIIATHDPMVEKYATQILSLKDGSIIKGTA
jgi:putative oligopeptide ABC transporter, ATP-binding protein